MTRPSLLFVLMILCLPVYASVRSSSFESSRWGDSVMQPMQLVTGGRSGAAWLDKKARVQGDDDDEEDDDQ